MVYILTSIPPSLPKDNTSKRGGITDVEAKHYSNNTTYFNISVLYQHAFLVEPDLFLYEHDQSVVIFVQSSHLNTARRELIRTTWANGSYYKKNRRPYVFFVSGLETRCHCVRETVRLEMSVRKDILLLAINDSYDNLTIKGLLTMAWIENKLNASVKFVIKTDDDVILNTFRWLSILSIQMSSRRSPFIIGYVWQRPAVQRTGRYAVSSKEYREDYYPAFCTGSGYAMSRNAVAVMLEMTSNVPFLKRDDPFITGLLAAEGHISRYTFNRMTYVLYPADFKTVRSWQRTMLVHGANSSIWHDVWNTYVLSSQTKSYDIPEMAVTFVTSEWFPKEVRKDPIKRNRNLR